MPEHDRRGRPTSYVSYWAQRTRNQRAAVFRLAEAGRTPTEIGLELGLDTAQVEAVLRTDRRRRSTG